MSATIVGTPIAQATPGSGESSTTLTITIPSGTTKLVVLTENVRYTPPPSVSSIALAAAALALVDTNIVAASGADYIRQECWYLDNPTPGASISLTVAWSGAARGAVFAFCVSGSAAGAPTTAKSGNSSALAVATTSGGLAVDIFATDEGGTVTVALSAGPTSLANFIGAAGAGGPSSRVGISAQAGTGSPATFTWTPTGGPAAVAHTAVAIAASSTTSAEVTGTGAAGMSGDEIRAGGKTLILTLTGETFLAFDDTIREAIRSGIDSASAPTWGWDAVRSQIPLANIVRTSATVCTITLPAIPGYQGDTTETLTVTLPATALTGGVALVATPTIAIARTITNVSPVDEVQMTGTATRTRLGNL